MCGAASGRGGFGTKRDVAFGVCTASREARLEEGRRGGKFVPEMTTEPADEPALLRRTLEVTSG